MTRRKQREAIFILTFESLFGQYTIDEIIELAEECGEVEVNDYVKNAVRTIGAHAEEIDARIEKKLVKWNKARISKVSLAIMRVSVFETFYDKDVPLKVSINEAVELAKQYAGEDEYAFINGVLGAVNSELEDAVK